MIFCDEEEIGVDDLPSEVTTEAGESVEGASVGVGAGGEFPPLQVMERAHIQRALERTEGNKSQAARLLGIDRMTLYARIKRHDIPI